MSNAKKELPIMPIHKQLMGYGTFGILATIATTPKGTVEFFNLIWPITGLMMMISVAMVVFGFTFGLVAAISARKAHANRMKQEAAAAAAADADASAPESQPEPSISKPIVSADSTALFAVPEPRVMVVDEVAKPNVEFPTSAKA